MFDRRCRRWLLIVSALVLAGACNISGCSPGTENTGRRSPPLVQNADVSGSWVQGQTTAASVTCVATAATGRILAVTADLAALGGPQVQLGIGPDVKTWSWTGSLTPPRSGTFRVPLVVTTDDGQETAIDIAVAVAAPPANQPPWITNLAVQAPLTRGLPAEMTLSCNVTDADGTIQTVTADLSSLGGGTVSLHGRGGDVYTWSGTVSSADGGARKIHLVATDDRGARAEAEYTVDVKEPPVNQPPEIDDASAAGGIKQGAASSLTLFCRVRDSDGTVQSVAADLSAVGGVVVQLTVDADGTTWSWSGTITPPAAGQKIIRLVATDDAGATAVADVSTTVAAPDNQPPRIGGVAVAGILQQGLESSLTVSCSASDSDGAVQSVTADLTAVGGTVVQLAAGSDGTAWSWTGHVIPAASGRRTISLLATDDAAATARVEQTVDVAAPPEPPRIRDAAAVGPLRRGIESSLIVSCAVSDGDGVVTSVTADLTALGGAVVQLTASADGTTWSWTGTVTPPQAGEQAIGLTATDDDGATAAATVSIRVAADELVIVGIEKEGVVRQRVSSTFTLSCEVRGFSGTVTVTADLSTLGAGRAEPLVSGGDGRWSWTGTIKPEGDWSWKPIYVEATDSGGAQTRKEEWVYVAAAMLIRDPEVTGRLQVGVPGEITISCRVDDALGKTVSVTMDLSNFGVEPKADMQEGADDIWSWTGTLTAPAEGPYTVLLLALDDLNDWSELAVTIPVGP